MFDIAVVCARCQPPTRAHFAALAEAATLARQVVMLVLNADDARSPANPFDNETRAALLRAGMAGEVRLAWLRDRRYEPARWAAAAAAAVQAVAGDGRVVVFADSLAASTSVPVPDHWQRAAGEVQLAAAEAAARDLLVRAEPAWGRLAAMLPPPVLAAVQISARDAAFAKLVAEAEFLENYRSGWQAAPYPPVFVTVDAVASWRDQVLLIERGQPPGRGLWALPGGFIDLDETVAVSCLRELREETGVTLDEASIVARRVFDDPLRSQRGRTITHAFRFVLDALPAPPLAVGADDAAAAAWVPIASLQPQRMFDDHYFILQTLLALD